MFLNLQKLLDPSSIMSAPLGSQISINKSTQDMLLSSSVNSSMLIPRFLEILESLLEPEELVDPDRSYQNSLDGHINRSLTHACICTPFDRTRNGDGGGGRDDAILLCTSCIHTILFTCSSQ